MSSAGSALASCAPTATSNLTKRKTGLGNGSSVPTVVANSSADRSCKPKIIRTGGIEWTTEERNLLRDNRDKTSKQMMALLPRRSQQSIISMRDKTGFTYQNPFGWNDVEDRKLRKLAETLCATDIAKVMPGRTYSSVFDRAKKLGIKLRSRTRPHVMTGDPLIDAIRKRALEDGMSVMALDRELGTKQYFSSDCLSARKRGQRGRFDKIAKAVEYFGGELTIDWKDE